MSYTGQPVPTTTTQLPVGKTADGRSVIVTLPAAATITRGHFAYLDGFLGQAHESYTSGAEETTKQATLEIEPAVYTAPAAQLTAGRTFAKGARVYWNDSTKKFTDAFGAGFVFAGIVTRTLGAGTTFDFLLASQGDIASADDAADASAAVAAVAASVGDLGDLETDDKETIVGAVNEVKALADLAVVGEGLAIARGVAEVTGMLAVVTGLDTVVSIVGTLAEDPSADATIVTAVIPSQAGADAGKATLKVWKPTAADNSAPTAAVVAKNVAWVAVGTPAAE